MRNVTLRDIQLAQFEIAKEIKRTCEENEIQYLRDQECFGLNMKSPLRQLL